MARETNWTKRSGVGYGSTYRRGGAVDSGATEEIASVLGGQVWMVKPDKKARAEHPCLWMAAGVVKYKDCTNFFDCTSCSFNRAMTRQVAAGKQISWQAAMRRNSALGRVCRHSLTHRIEHRTCAYDYRCAACDFDQYFEDVLTPKTDSVPTEVHTIKGFAVPMGHYFHKGHTWARIESGGYIRIGMDDFALKLLGRADGYDLPLMGKELQQDSAGWGIRRKSNVADVLAPVDGVIVEVNQKIKETPAEANRDPFGSGWLFTVYTPDIKGTVNKLMPDKTGMAWMGEEVGTLEAMIEDVAGPLAADGGTLMEDIYGNLPALGWDNLTSTFLKT